MRKALKIILALLLLALSAFVAMRMMQTRPKARREARPAPVQAVEAATAIPAEGRVEVKAMGTVVPSRRLTLQAEIPGRVLELHPGLERGGRVREGELLLRIERRDYEIIRDQLRTQVQRAEAELNLEKGRAAVAAREWELFRGEIVPTEEGQKLALREPQRQAAAAALEGARSALEKAELDLSRTEISAPFDALVLDESLEVGMHVAPQAPLATLVASDEYQVQVSLPQDRLGQVSFPRRGQGGSKVRVMQEYAPGNVRQWRGVVTRLLGEVDPLGRMARLIVAVADPLAGEHPLLLGAYVSVAVEGPSAEGTVAVPARGLKEGNRVYVVDGEGTMEIRKVQVFWEEGGEVLINEGLRAGEKVVLSRIAAPVNGMSLKVNGGGEGEEEVR